MENYWDWKDRKTGTPPRNDTMRTDIDECIRQSLVFEDFIFRMRKLGYTVQYGPNLKYMTVRAPGAERSRRVYKLGDEYTEEAIRRRISENTPEQVAQAIRANRAGVKDQEPKAQKVVRVQWNGKRRTHKKLKGLQARYYRILYTFGMIRSRPRTQANRSMYYSLYDQLRQFDGYIRQMKLLSTCDVKTVEELSALRESCISEISVLAAERRALYRHPDNADGGLKVEIDQLTARITELRRIVRDCDAIEVRSNATIDRIREAEQQKSSQNRKSKGLHEQQR
jgi:hypothetical protein